MDKEDSEKYDEACKALEKYCKENNCQYWQPNKYSSWVGWRYVHLRNIDDMYAKYDLLSKQIVDKK